MAGAIKNKEISSMKVIVSMALSVLPLLSFAQDQQVVCMQTFDEQLKKRGYRNNKRCKISQLHDALGERNSMCAGRQMH